MPSGNIAVFLLGGRGSRFGSPTPKQFHQIQKNPKEFIFERSALCLLNGVSVSSALFLIPEGLESSKRALFDQGLGRLKARFPHLDLYFTEGGSHRHESLERGVHFLKKKGIKSKILLIHDANRPFLSDEFLSKVNQEINRIDHKRACSVPVVASADSLVLDEGGQLSYLPRKKVYQVQTPQLLLWESLLAAFQKKKENRFWTDEGSFMIDMGFPVFHYQGDVGNRKITHREDIP